ncbi:putative methyltransferase PMT5 [Cucumis melo var. makuwa]|uniref:Methyltransferase n=1 Tax=Cucumis melo var. makuwa TaxID=1194695 RepID=A0A5A7SX74_CUCMM|nr:putative methyltransferase PMT5 [Cucumis melo var. makuwa]
MIISNICEWDLLLIPLAILWKIESLTIDRAGLVTLKFGLKNFCAIGVWLLGTSTSNAFDSVTTTPVSDIYASYRRQKERAAIDLFDLKSLSLATTRLKEFGLCGKERENHVPCYNVTANLLAGYKEGEEYDRHCEVSRTAERCLVRPPKDYKIPLSWPVGRDIIWSGNVKVTRDQLLSSGSPTKRLMLLEENQIAFHSEDGDGVKEYSFQIAEMIGLGSDSEFFQAGVRSILDIGCGFGSLGAHLISLNVMAMCIATYEATGSQVQMALERGLPAMLGNFATKQLPYPSLSFDMVHCAQCDISWNDKGGIFLIEADRLLRPGGYFVLTSPTGKTIGGSLSSKKTNILTPLEEMTKKLCWILLAQQYETYIWQKTTDPHCYSSRKQEVVPLCKEAHDTPSYYQPLVPCLSSTTSKRWIPIQNRSSGSHLSSAELEDALCSAIDCIPMSISTGVQSEDYSDELQIWRSALKNYWSLLTPLIFSDHPKRPGDEDPLPPFNMIRNVMDMNAHYGGLNAAFVEQKKTVWVMNVVPVGSPNTLPLILDQGFAGVLHDWCEPFPTYPRTYDLLHANGLLSQLLSSRCNMIGLLLEMDRILRPEGWVVLKDKVGPIEKVRMLATQIRWEARVIDFQNGSDQRLLVCQKPFVKK